MRKSRVLNIRASKLLLKHTYHASIYSSTPVFDLFIAPTLEQIFRLFDARYG